MVDSQQGFVLTRHWRDTPAGTLVEFWLATDAGPRRVRLPVQPSVAFIPERFREQTEALLGEETGVELRPLGLQDFQHRPVFGLYCQQHRQLMHLEGVLRRAGIDIFEADIRPPERYLMERFLTAPVTFRGTPDAEGVLVDAHLKPAPDSRPDRKSTRLNSSPT